MNLEMKAAFHPESQSIWTFLIEPGCGYYMPAYQRPYAWGSQEIARLFEDVIHSIRQLTASNAETMQNESVARFLGAIIALHDSEYKTVQPIHQSEVPNKVMTIIDGQQRICTIVMVNIVLHNHIDRLSHSFHKLSQSDPENGVWKWISKECKSLLPDLKETYLYDKRAGDEHYQYYPKVIRAYDDVWASTKGQARYNSPVANFIWEYIQFTEKQATQNTKPRIFSFHSKSKQVDNASRDIRKYIKLISHLPPYSAQNLPDFLRDFLNPSDIAKFFSESGFEKFWEFNPADEAREEISKYLESGQTDSKHKEFCQLLRLLIFARYLNHSVAITVITAKNEDGAFDMFEALNTTGQPLTAFETFKPKVIEREKLEKYKDSESYPQMEKIEKYLNKFEKPSDKSKKTFEMLVAFALAETGEALPKRLNDQRRYLRGQYNRFQNDNEARAFVSSLANTASFLQFGWDASSESIPKFNPLKIVDDVALIGFEALRKIKHSITIAPLSRFYQNAVRANNEEAKKEFIAAIKATAAFSFLWRGAHGGTENIDSKYRDIMESGVDNFPPMARRPKGAGSGSISFEEYRSSLLHILVKANIGTEEQWVNKAHKVDYKKYRDVSRFLLFCAADDAIPDTDHPGLVQRGRTGICSFLSPKQWHREELFTIEHIAPQSPGGNWDQEIYDNDWVNTLGNLTLLPKSENNVLGNKPWEEKKLIYRLFAAQTRKEFNSRKKELLKAGAHISSNADGTLDNSRYLELCRSIAQSDKWDAGIIENRSKCLATLAWERLNSWLNE